jgi:branched-chain amino acid aminotransferase
MTGQNAASQPHLQTAARQAICAFPMAKPLLIYLDGKIVPESEAKISVFDHGLLYGDGVFEGIRFYSGRVFRLTEHLTRLYESARSILLTMPLTVAEMEKATLDTIAANGLRDGYIRLVVTRGVGPLGLNPYQCPKASVFIIASSISLYPAEKCNQGLVMVTCATRRPSPAALSPQVKSLNYLNNIMAKLEAIQGGGEEGIMLNEQGYVAECTGDNVFLVKDGKITTPPIAAGGLDGITRRAVMEILEQEGNPVREVDMTRHDIYTADECFLTGTAAEVIAAVQLDRRPIGDGKPGSVTRKLVEKFHALVNSTGTPVVYP